MCVCVCVCVYVCVCVCVCVCDLTDTLSHAAHADQLVVTRPTWIRLHSMFWYSLAGEDQLLGSVEISVEALPEGRKGKPPTPQVLTQTQIQPQTHTRICRIGVCVCVCVCLNVCIYVCMHASMYVRNANGMYVHTGLPSQEPLAASSADGSCAP